jgi:hypothetical protein
MTFRVKKIKNLRTPFVLTNGAGRRPAFDQTLPSLAEVGHLKGQRDALAPATFDRSAPFIGDAQPGCSAQSKFDKPISSKRFGQAKDQTIKINRSLPLFAVQDSIGGLEQKLRCH